jgi:type I restriction enzyme S subunit
MKYIENQNLKIIKLGDYIKKSTSNNSDLKYGEEFIVGVSNKGIFSEPKGNVSGVNLKPYKIVNKGAFVYNPSRLDLGSIAYRTDEVCIVWIGYT